MNRDELIREMARRASFTIGDVEVILETLIDVMEDCIFKGEEIKVRRFGILYLQNIPERAGWNRITKSRTTYPPTKRIIFKLAENIRNAWKNKGL